MDFAALFSQGLANFLFHHFTDPEGIIKMVTMISKMGGEKERSIFPHTKILLFVFLPALSRGSPAFTLLKNLLKGTE